MFRANRYARRRSWTPIRKGKLFCLSISGNLDQDLRRRLYRLSLPRNLRPPEATDIVAGMAANAVSKIKLSPSSPRSASTTPLSDVQHLAMFRQQLIMANER